MFPMYMYYCCMIYLFDSVALKQLVSDLTPVAYKWYSIGTHLKIPPGILHNIKTTDGEAYDCLLQMIEEWLNKGRATKAKLVEAVQSPSIRKKRISDKIAGTIIASSLLRINSLDHSLLSQISGSKLPDKLKIEHLSDVVKAVADLAAHWYPLGVQLDVSRAKLQAFEQQPRNVHRGLDSMLGEWMDGTPQKEDLFDALKGSGVNQRALAETLEEKYKGDAIT